MVKYEIRICFGNLHGIAVYYEGDLAKIPEFMVKGTKISLNNLHNQQTIIDFGKVSYVEVLRKTA